MQRSVLVCLAVWSALVWTTSGQTGSTAAIPGRTDGTQPTPLVEQYCVSCHNPRTNAGGLSLQGRPLQASETDVWEKVIRKVSSGQMPPAGMARPDPAALQRFVRTLEGTLDRFAAARPNPGPTQLHRLNRAEYANAIRDLLALEIDAAALLPADETSHGFDNIADALGISPVVLERYLSAANRISALAVGDAPSGPVARTFVARADSHQLDHVEGLPLGTRGGLLIRDTVPVDGEYQLSAKLYRTNNGFTRGLSAPHDVEFLVDGERVFQTTVGGQEDWMELLTRPGIGADRVDAKLQARVRLKAGAREIGVTFVRKTGARNQAFFRPLIGTTDVVDSDGIPRIDAVTLTGPLTVEGVSETRSRQQVFSCRPSNPQQERGCAADIARRLGRLAFRRPLTQEEVTHLLGYYDAERQREGSFEAGVQMVVRRLLADPSFLFRAETEPAAVAAGRVYPLSDLELASSLSFFLWSSIPDDELLRVAEQGRLREEQVYRRQVQRMLADPRSAALVSNFAGQWLQLRNLSRVAPDPMKYPDFDDGLRQAFRQETELLFASIMQEDRSILDLLRADYTFVNERLARHYGIPNVAGSHFRRVAVTDPARRGLLGHGSILTVTSHPNRTSPVKRGKWVLEQLLGSPPPPPPPNVPPLEESANRTRPRTMKERMEEHRRNPACANCHRLMDPVGLALENFDGVGAYRLREAGMRIDTTTQLSDGTNINDAPDLRDALLARSSVFVRTFTENLLVYALGRGLTADDMPAVRQIIRDAEQQQHRFAAIVQGIAGSAPFRTRLKSPPMRRAE